MVELFYGARFHQIMKDGGYTSRIRIYSMDWSNYPVLSDWTMPFVEEYGQLLKYKNSDTDSGGRIGQDGIKINSYINKEEQIEVGNVCFGNIEISLINDDGFFSTYDWNRYAIVVYFDVWDEANNMWLTCPLGIYWWERPTKTSPIVIKARANDGMTMASQYAAVWPDDSEWENGLSLYDLLDSAFTGTVAGYLRSYSYIGLANKGIVYYKAPFDITNMTLSEFIGEVAKAGGTSAFFHRQGELDCQFFKDATYQPASQYYTIDADSNPTVVISIDIGEYSVPPIDKTIAQTGQSGAILTSGNGTNAIYIVNNGFLNVDSVTAQGMVDAIHAKVSDLPQYRPISISLYGDPSIEPGDIVRVVYDGQTYILPVFQQTMSWNGAEWFVEIQSSGFESRRLPSEEERYSYVSVADLTETNSTITTQASVSNGVISFKNASGTTLYTATLPVYNGGVS